MRSMCVPYRSRTGYSDNFIACVHVVRAAVCSLGISQSYFDINVHFVFTLGKMYGAVVEHGTVATYVTHIGCRAFKAY